MLHKIRRSLKYFIILIGVIIMLPTALYLLLQTAEIQTFLVKRVTNHFSSEFKSSISIGSIDYKFFNRLSVNNVLIKDKNNDTLMYARQIIAGIKRIDFKNRVFRMGRVSLFKPVFAIITDSTGLTNLNWYLNLLNNSADSMKKGGGKFVIDQIDLKDAHFHL